MPEYFTGRGNDLGNVARSQATSFTEVVNIHMAQPIPLAMTKARYDGMTKEEQDAAKKVQYLIAATFPSSPHRRKEMGNTGVCNLIFLDIDPVKVKNKATNKWEYTGECPARPFVEDPDLLVRQLSKFNFAAYLTASHTAKYPRLRVVVDADGIPATRYAEAVNTVGKMLGLPVVTRESEIAVQAMYLPVMFSDQTEHDHPLITCMLPSDEQGTRAFTEADIIEGAGTDFTRRYEHANRLPSNPNALDFLRPPVDEVTLDVAREALAKIDPDLDRPDWLRMGMALKHQFWHDSEEAFNLFDDWSRGALNDDQLFAGTAGKYMGTEKTRATWDSFQPSPDNRVPVTVRTLLVKAVESGWHSGMVKDQCFTRVSQWVKTGAKSFSQLTSEGVRRIAVMPLATTSEEDALLRLIADEAHKQFQMRTTIPALRKELMLAKRQIEETSEEEKKTKIPAWGKGWVFVTAHNLFFRQRTGERVKPDALDNTYGMEMPLTDDFRPVTAPHDVLLNCYRIERVYDFQYNPAEPDSIITKDRGRLYVNTYVRTHPDPDKRWSGKAGSIFYNHLVNIIAEPEYRRILVDWMAYMVQFPGRKVTWAPLIQGAPGAGKTAIADAMRAVLGGQHVKTVDVSAIKRGWNEWSDIAQLVVIEEIRVAGVNRHEIMNELKQLVTNRCINVNERSTNSREALNRTNYILFSNFHDALAIGHDDRRYFVLKTIQQSREQVLALGGATYFKAFYNMVDTMAAGLRAWLESWQISPGFEPFGHPPVTIYQEQLVSDSASDSVAAVRKIIMDGENPLVTEDLVSAKNLMDMLRSEEGLQGVSSQKVAHILRDEGYTNVCRPMMNGVRHYLWARGLEDMSEASVSELARQRVENWAASQNL